MSLFNWIVTVQAGGQKQEFTGSCDLSQGENHISVDLPACTILSVKGAVRVPLSCGEAIFMNGYQTWTACPEYHANSAIRGLNGIPSRLIEKYHFDGYSDYHFVDYPSRPGVTHGFSWCTFRNGRHVRLFASLNEEPGYTMFEYHRLGETLRIARDCEGMEWEGAYPIFDLYLDEGGEQAVYDGWFDHLPQKKIDAPQLYGYSSWYNRYQDINEAAIRQDLDGCKTIFEPGDLFQIDDGWEPYVGDWLDVDTQKFPNGLRPIVDDIHASGFKAGLWLAPFVAETNSLLYREHPNWFYTWKGEKFVCGSNWSGFYSLNIDLPEVQQYLRDTFHKVFDEWGFDLVKLDFLYGAAPYGNNHETRAARMIRAMKFLREVCGDHAILGCGVPVMPAFGLVEYCRISCDVTLDWNDKPYMQIIHRERPSTKQAIANTISRRGLNNRAYLSDPDVFFLRKENCSLTDAQKDELATIGALLGGVFLTSDDPSSYTEEMKQKYRYYRHLTNAKVTLVRPLRRGVTITYELDGSSHTVTYTH